MPNQREVGSEEVVYPTTVTLVADPQDKLKMFFCFNCQAPFGQYKGSTLSVEPGRPHVEPYTVQKCKNSRCPMMFSFSPIVEMSKRYLM